MSLRLEEVFKVQGVPTHTFVEPSQYGELLVALRTAGRGVVVEGPSGIGKSTAVDRALADIGSEMAVTHLSARKPKDLEYIAMLPDISSFGVVVVDDFHRLPNDIRASLADFLKTLADEEAEDRKLVLIGINSAGHSLVQFGTDLGNRLEIITFEAEPETKIEELIAKGEAALNVQLEARDQIAEAAQGSFYVAQLLCHNACLQAGLLVMPDEQVPVRVPTLYPAIRRALMKRLALRFEGPTRGFARGTRFRPSGRAPYLHILRWLTESDSWSIDLKNELALHQSERISVSQVVDKGYLRSLVDAEPISSIFHFDSDSKVFSVEDPQFYFYLRNLDWPAFVRDAGFTRVDFDEEYDIALSFAGEDRPMAEALRDQLEDQGLAVFYDLAEQHSILGNDVEAYLGPIYSSNSRYVLALLGEKYGAKRWTMFEAEQYRDRVESGQVLVVKSNTLPLGPLDPVNGLGLLEYDPSGDLIEQAADIGGTIARKLASEA